MGRVRGLRLVYAMRSNGPHLQVVMAVWSYGGDAGAGVEPRPSSAFIVAVWNHGRGAGNHLSRAPSLEPHPSPSSALVVVVEVWSYGGGARPGIQLPVDKK
jgi:hypothetical protein